MKKEFNVIIEKDNEGYFIATVPELSTLVESIQSFGWSVARLQGFQRGGAITSICSISDQNRVSVNSRINARLDCGEFSRNIQHCRVYNNCDEDHY